MPGMSIVLDHQEQPRFAYGATRFLFGGLENIDPAEMAPRIAVEFKARDGLSLHGFLTRPKAAGGTALPLVLLRHGIADEWLFDTDAQFFASRGYAVLQVNFRGSGGRGDAFIKSGYREWGGKIQSDLIDGVQWAIAPGFADPSRICVCGASVGAYSAMMLPVRAPQRFKCAIGYAGVYNLAMLYRTKVSDRDAPRNGAALLKRDIGDDGAQQRRESPVALAGQIKMRDALFEAGNRAESMPVSAEGHDFYLSANRLEVYQKRAEFLARFLAPPRPVQGERAAATPP